MKTLYIIISFFLTSGICFAQDKIEKASDNEIKIVSVVETVYSKEYIEAKCIDYDNAIINLQNEAQKWYDLRQISDDMNLKTSKDIEIEKAEPIPAQGFFGTPKKSKAVKKKVKR